MKLFVSYRRDDWSFTYWLVEELKLLLDAEIFVDFSGISDSNFETSLLRNLHESDAILLIVTKNTFTDRIHNQYDWVRREIYEALTQHKPIALACHNGIFPIAAELPVEIQLISKVQGIEFYPRYFKAGVRELAAFIGRSTPIKLREAATLASPAITSPPKSDKASYDHATTLVESGHYEQALELLADLKVRGYQPRYSTLDDIISDVTKERNAEQRRWEAGERYDEVVALLRINPSRARLAWGQFRVEYPEYHDDPAQITAKLTQPISTPVPPIQPTYSLQQTDEAQSQRHVLPSIGTKIDFVIYAVLSVVGVVVILALIFKGPSKGLSPAPTTAAAAPTNTPRSILPTSTSIASIIGKIIHNNDWNPQSQNFDGVDMLKVPPGCFNMGSETGVDNERPVTEICFDQPFWIDKTEVTQAQFKHFNGKAGSAPTFTGDNHPVEEITWLEARDYCASRGARLPTEAEWEYTARGPDNLVYPWGNDFIADNVVFNENSNHQTADVGSRPNGKSWVGALDLSGNVWEWTSSLYKTYPYNDEHEDSDNSSYGRVIRGSSWGYGKVYAHAAIRYSYDLLSRYNSLGFRCVRSFSTS